MTTKRIIVLLTLVVGTYFLVVIGRLLLLGHYRQKADVALFLSGDYKTAIKYYDKLIYWQPETAGYYYNRGDAYDKDEQFEKAISDYKRALNLGGTDQAQTILRIAITAKHCGDMQTEEYYLLRLLELTKNYQKYSLDFWAANYHLGRLEFRRKNYRKAINYYTIANRAYPARDDIYHRANAYYALGQFDSARKDLQNSIRLAKMNYVRKYPNSTIAKCDTCAFPFGSKEYELLTDIEGETIIKTFDKFPNDKRALELNDKLKATEKNSR